MTMKKALVQIACVGWTALAVSLAQGAMVMDPAPVAPDIAITTNALSTASVRDEAE